MQVNEEMVHLLGNEIIARAWNGPGQKRVIVSKHVKAWKENSAYNLTNRHVVM